MEILGSIHVAMVDVSHINVEDQKTNYSYSYITVWSVQISIQFKL